MPEQKKVLFHTSDNYSYDLESISKANLSTYPVPEIVSVIKEIVSKTPISNRDQQIGTIAPNGPSSRRLDQKSPERHSFPINNSRKAATNS